jgi:hypothetical protein
MSGCYVVPLLPLVKGVPRGLKGRGVVIKSRSDDFTIQICHVVNNLGDGIHVRDSASVLVFTNLVEGRGNRGVDRTSRSPVLTQRCPTNLTVGRAAEGTYELRLPQYSQSCFSRRRRLVSSPIFLCASDVYW